jgi:beta-N-acetylhexosaminidase
MKTAILLLLLLALVVTGCQVNSNPPSGDDPSPEEDRRIAELSLPQKVGQLLYIGLAQNDMDLNQEILSELQPGGLILFSRNFTTLEQTVVMLNSYRQNEDLAWPLFVGTDQEGGTVSRLPSAWATTFPTARLVGEQADQAKDLAVAMGSELAALGLNMNFAPVLDVHSNPKNPVIGNRAFGSTPEDVWVAGQQVIAGLSSQGMIPVVKHFPGHGDTSTDSHLELPLVAADRKLLEDRELWPFWEAVQAEVPAVMVGHLLVPALDAEHPASLSQAVITGLLRDQWGYQRLVVTDDLEMGAIAQDNIGEAAVQAVLAGADMLLVCHSYDKQVAVRDALLEAVQQGRISEARIDQSLQRILQLKDQYRVHKQPVDLEQASQVVGSPGHRDLVDSLGK